MADMTVLAVCRTPRWSWSSLSERCRGYLTCWKGHQSLRCSLPCWYSAASPCWRYLRWRCRFRSIRADVDFGGLDDADFESLDDAGLPLCLGSPSWRCEYPPTELDLGDVLRLVKSNVPLVYQWSALHMIKSKSEGFPVWNVQRVLVTCFTTAEAVL